MASCWTSPAQANYLGAAKKPCGLDCHVPFRKFGGRIVFRRTELEQFIEYLPGVTVAQAQANLAARHI